MDPLDGAATTPSTVTTTTGPQPMAPAFPTRQEIEARYGGTAPTQWAMDGVDGLVSRTKSPGVVFTFDACGGAHGDHIDQPLIDTLINEEVPAVLFINSRWVGANQKLFEALAERDDLFEIANHGTRHLPLSVNGKSAYGIAGTKSPGEVYDEVAGNHHILTALLGKAPRWFRCGTAHYDEVAVRIANDLGEKPVGFDINGDGGATFSAKQVDQEVLRASAGSIVISHFNRPSSGTAAGYATAIPKLRARGLEIVALQPELLL